MSIVVTPLVLTMAQVMAQTSSLITAGLSAWLSAGLSSLLMGSLVMGYMMFWAVASTGPLGLYWCCCSSSETESNSSDDESEPSIDANWMGTVRTGQTVHIATQPTWSLRFRKALTKASRNLKECQFKTVVWATIEAGKSYLVFTGEGPYPHLCSHINPSETLVVLAPPSAETERRDPIDFVKEFSSDATLKACTVVTARWSELQFINRHGRFPERLIGEMNPSRRDGV